MGGSMNRIGSPAPQKYEITVNDTGKGKYLSLQSKEFDGQTLKLIYGRADKMPSNSLFQKLKNIFNNPTHVRSGLEAALKPTLEKMGPSKAIGTHKANAFKAQFFAASNQNSSSQKVDADRFLRKINTLNLANSHIETKGQASVSIKVVKA